MLSWKATLSTRGPYDNISLHPNGTGPQLLQYCKAPVSVGPPSAADLLDDGKLRPRPSLWAPSGPNSLSARAYTHRPRPPAAAAGAISLSPPCRLWCGCRLSRRKTGAKDGPKRAVLPSTRQRRPVGERRPRHPLRRLAAPPLCSRPLLLSAGGRGGWGMGRAAAPVAGIAGCGLLSTPVLSRVRGAPILSSRSSQSCFQSGQTPLRPPACAAGRCPAHPRGSPPDATLAQGLSFVGAANPGR